MPTELKIKGQAELERAFLQLRRDVLVELKPAILEIANLVREDAQGRAGSEIANIGSKWQQMRVGVTIKGAYVAPRARNRGGSKRPNLAGELKDAMEEALEAKRSILDRRMNELVDVSAAKAGFH
jgi:hypothetical protein